MLPIEHQNFRYTFPKETITNMDFPEGIYTHVFRGDSLVLKVDKFGEVRLANETPCNNESKLAKDLVKVKPISFLETVNAQYRIVSL